MAAVLLFSLTACSAGKKQEEEPVPQPQVEKNGKVVILFTSDIHCGIDTGFGMDGVRQVRDTLEAQGYTTLLVDDGDAIQGEAIGILTKGKAIADMMNALHYDVAVPGNHEFDYGTDVFLQIAEAAEFPYICCNLTKDGKAVLPDHVVIEAAGIKIGFVGAVTPNTLTKSTPTNFMNEEGEFVYGFMRDEDGSALYEAIQKAADAARAEGADLVYLLGHLGMDSTDSPWTYADVIANTRGIDVVLDGHTHDTVQVVMKNLDGEDVPRSACGTKLNCIGYSFIDPEKGVEKTGIWSWSNSETPAQVLGYANEITDKIAETLKEFNELLSQKIADLPFELTINDPNERDSSGNPVRMVRRAETNLADLCADAIRDATGADIALINGGGVRTSIPAGELTYGDVMSVMPFCNNLCSVQLTGQQIIDALEWGCRALPDQLGGFLQVSGLSYVVDISIPSSCTEDANGMFSGVDGPRRVRSVKVGGEDIDPAELYTVGGSEYILIERGDGFSMFEGAPVIIAEGKLDSQAFIDYVTVTMEGTVSRVYEDPYGQGRIVIRD